VVLVVERVTTRARVLNAMKTMDIARRNAGKNKIDIIQSGTNNSTGDVLECFESRKGRIWWRARIWK